MTDDSPTNEIELRAPKAPDTSSRYKGGYACDRCGDVMIEFNCKIVCLNCGHRFDCSDLSIYFD